MNEPQRRIRSFVMRGGRATAAQQRALCELWPRFGLDFSAVAVDLDDLFGRRALRTVEIGFGNGDHLASLADRHPDRDYLGIEVHPPGVGHLLQRAAALELANLRVSRHDAVEVLTWQLPAASIDAVLVLFPDPWHKKRHHKRRLINAPFLDAAARCMRSGAILHLATDWEPYAEHMLQTLREHAAFENLSPTGDYAPRDPEREATRFERRGERLGHAVHDLTFRRR